MITGDLMLDDEMMPYFMCEESRVSLKSSLGEALLNDRPYKLTCQHLTNNIGCN